MTQPDQAFPDGSVNSGPFSAFAAKTGDDWQAEQRSSEENRWGGGLADVLFNALRTGISLPAALAEAIVEALLAPFDSGSSGDSNDLADVLGKLALVWSAPWQILGNIPAYLEDLFNELQGQSASQQHQINTLKLQLDDADPKTGATDNCSTLDHVSDVVGTLELTGWGAWKADSLSVWLYDLSPTTDRHGMGLMVKAKQPGRTILWICSDDTATSGCGLLLEVQSGTDTVSVVTRTATDTYVVRKSIDMEIPTNSFWQIYYEPFDEDSPTSNTFHVFMNSNAMTDVRWTDAGNSVLHDADHRRVGGTQEDGFAVTDLAFDDWDAAAPQ
jgi:hypothetical protein